MNLADLFLTGVTACMLAWGSTRAAAEEYPAKAIKFISLTNLGTASDTVGRLMAERMSKILGQVIIVENKLGAGMAIGMEYVARLMPADGYTVALVVPQALLTLPLTSKNLSFDVLKDITPVIDYARQRLFIVSSNRKPWKTFAELVEHARANPGTLNYGSPSSYVRLMAESITRTANVNITAVPYAGTGPYNQVLLTGEVDVGFTGETTVGALFPGRFCLLAVTGNSRHPAYPDVPTFVELGLPNFVGVSWSLGVRTGTPRPVIDRLFAAASQVLQQPDVKARFVGLQLEQHSDNTEAVTKSLQEESRMLRGIARTIGLIPE